MRKFTKYPQGYVKASIASSSWFRTDDYQICKDLGGGVYDFIEFIGADGQMFSSSGTVNVNDYKDPDGSWNAEALDIIRSYYSDLDELHRSVSNPTDEDQIVAECIFEQTSSYDSGSLTMSEDEAYTYLDDVISGKVMASSKFSTIKASSVDDNVTTEYAVEIYLRDADSPRGSKFWEQVDVYSTYEQAKKYCLANPLTESDEFYVIRAIDYDAEEGFEVSSEIVEEFD